MTGLLLLVTMLTHAFCTTVPAIFLAVQALSGVLLVSTLGNLGQRLRLMQNLVMTKTNQFPVANFKVSYQLIEDSILIQTPDLVESDSRDQLQISPQPFSQAQETLVYVCTYL